MCGIIGIVSKDYSVSPEIYEALIMLQHRGQDTAGIATNEKNIFHTFKKKGLVKEIFGKPQIEYLEGKMGVGHVRYPTAGVLTDDETQPLYTNMPLGISLTHNGNLTNTEELKAILNERMRHINSDSDSEILLNIFASELRFQLKQAGKISHDVIYQTITNIQKILQGAYCVILIISGYGLVAFRDPHGIRPLVIGQKNNSTMVASESVALEALGYEILGDIKNGEAVIIEKNGDINRKICYAKEFRPCIFEYVYLSRADSILDNMSVHQARKNMGKLLAYKVDEILGKENIDVVIAIPETSRVSAIELAKTLKIPYAEGFVKNNYVGRTFIMANQQIRNYAVKQKINPIGAEFKGKRVLLVDDSIVRGNTSKQIIKMARDAGAVNIYIASCAPPIRYKNVYGIDMPKEEDLIAHNQTRKSIADLIGADEVIYQNLSDLCEAVDSNKKIHFETSCFDGQYVHLENTN